MGHEVRRVPADWQHPKDAVGRFVPLFDGSQYAEELAEWDAGAQKWAEGLRKDYKGGWQLIGDVGVNSYAEWDGERPSAADYMPSWPCELATHYMMYEDTTEGTPISPAFATPEELACWLTDNEASACGGLGASYEGWLHVCKGGFAPSMVLDQRGLRSGVEL